VGDRDGALAEYQTLRKEISETKNVRVLALGFALAFVGTAVDKVAGPQGTSVAGACLLVIAMALGLTIHTTQAIKVVSAYLRLYVEPTGLGPMWETRLKEHRDRAVRDWRTRVLSGGYSKTLAIAYLVIGVGVDWAWWCGSGRTAQELLGVGVLSALVAIVALDLYFEKSSGWKIMWPNPEVSGQAASERDP
jgi:hypothetical protein